MNKHRRAEVPSLYNKLIKDENKAPAHNGIDVFE